MKVHILLIILFLHTLPIFSQDSLFIYPSAKNIEVEIKSFVIKANHKFKYFYMVFNSTLSSQSISDFYLKFKSNLDSVQTPNFWIGGISGVWDNVYMWQSRDSLYNILPGDSSDDFNFISKGFPSIQLFFAKGYFEVPSVKEGEAPAESEIVGGGILENSVKGYTISPKDSPTPFIPINFIDTIKAYCDSSYALNWIKDEQTRDKYDNYFNTAKNYLNQNNNNAAKSELQKVLTDCNADSSSVLTSEAYALIYFNTDYLIKQIHEGEPGLPVKLEDR